MLAFQFISYFVLKVISCASSCFTFLVFVCCFSSSLIVLISFTWVLLILLYLSRLSLLVCFLVFASCVGGLFFTSLPCCWTDYLPLTSEFAHFINLLIHSPSEFCVPSLYLIRRMEKQVCSLLDTQRACVSLKSTFLTICCLIISSAHFHNAVGKDYLWDLLKSVVEGTLILLETSCANKSISCQFYIAGKGTMNCNMSSYWDASQYCDLDQVWDQKVSETSWRLAHRKHLKKREFWRGNTGDAPP